MSFIEFNDLKPPARRPPDGAPWTQYTLEASGDGQLWTPFEGPSPLNPAITDPASPPSYSFTSVDAPVDAIYFRVKWTDGAGVEKTTLPMMRPQELPAWTPTLGDVADYIMIRTKIGNGTVIGTFTDQTKPATAEAVERLIAKGVERVVPLFGYTIADAALADSARGLAALWAAMLVELNLYAEQINNEQSPYNSLKELWDDATGEDSSGQGDADDLTGHVDPSWRFERRKRLHW